MSEPSTSLPKSSVFPGSSPETDLFAPMGREAVSLAAKLLKSARAKETMRQRGQAAKLAGMMEDPAGKVFTLALADRLLRFKGTEKQAGLFQYLVDKHGIPKFLPTRDRLQMGLAAKLAPSFPGAVMPLVVERLRKECARFVLPASPEKLHSYLAQLRKTGFRATLNLLGDQILGEEQAMFRLDRLVALLQDPAVGSLSVKLSSILPQMDVFAFDESVAACSLANTSAMPMRPGTRR